MNPLTEWPGLCKTGAHQSPINIIYRINTQEDRKSYLSFQYNIKKDFAESYSKFTYDNRGLCAKVEMGNMVFTHEDGTQEHYKASEIKLHYPSEHTITKESQTPRYPLELQIYHDLTKTNNSKTTNKFITVKKAVVSILFKGDAKILEGDPFLSRMGIDERQKRPDGTYRVIQEGESIDSNEKWLGNIKPGFDINALLSLRDLLNYNHWIFRYYGSDTQPPCDEDVHWFVFAIPREANLEQIAFLKQQIYKTRS